MGLRAALFSVAISSTCELMTLLRCLRRLGTLSGIVTKYLCYYFVEFEIGIVRSLSVLESSMLKSFFFEIIKRTNVFVCELICG